MFVDSFMCIYMTCSNSKPSYVSDTVIGPLHNQNCHHYLSSSVIGPLLVYPLQFLYRAQWLVHHTIQNCLCVGRSDWSSYKPKRSFVSNTMIGPSHERRPVLFVVVYYHMPTWFCEDNGWCHWWKRKNVYNMFFFVLIFGMILWWYWLH